MPYLVLGLLANNLKLALERQVVVACQPLRIASNENLTHDRFTQPGRVPQPLIGGRHRPPAENGLSFGADNLLNVLLA